jgi:hypothetical protein
MLVEREDVSSAYAAGDEEDTVVFLGEFGEGFG